MPSKTDKKENIERIKERYPNEWLLIIDYETDVSTRTIKGRLVAHSKSREEIHRALAKHRGKSNWFGKTICAKIFGNAKRRQAFPCGSGSSLTLQAM